MNFAYSSRRTTIILAFGLFLTGVSAQAAPEQKSAPEPKPVKIKNGHSIRVVLGAKKEPALGIRPEKTGWKLVLAPELAGGAAELQDITPNVPAGTQWTLPVTAEGVVLDEERFLPSHVYRLEVRKDDKLAGNAIVYLYPPATPRSEKVEFSEDEKGPGKGGPIASTPKGGLSVDRSTGRSKPK